MRFFFLIIYRYKSENYCNLLTGNRREGYHRLTAVLIYRAFAITIHYRPITVLEELRRTHMGCGQRVHVLEPALLRPVADSPSDTPYSPSSSASSFGWAGPMGWAGWRRLVAPWLAAGGDELGPLSPP